VAWWPGDDSAADLSLAANDGQMIDGATFGEGAIGRAFELDGLNDRIDVPDSPSLRPQRFTLAAWVRVDVPLEWACILCKQYGSGGANSYSLWLNNGILQGGMFGFAEAAAPSAFLVGKVQHVAVSWDGAIIRLYIDGHRVSAAPGPASAVPYDSNQVILGAEDNGVNAYTAFFDGMIDEAQIFGRALSSCEIRALYRARPHGACTGDVDGDALRDFEDNCPQDANAGQQDADGDGTGDVCDCAPADASLAAAPGDLDLLVATAADALDWCLDPSVHGSGTVYDLLRGDLDALPVATESSECLSRCLAAPSGLVGWWPGDGTAEDLVLGNTGALENGATFGPGWIREAFVVDGANDRVRTSNVTLGPSFSVAAWVRSAVVNQGAYQRIVENSFSSHFYLGTDAGGTGYKLIVNSPSSPYGAVQGGTIAPGEWQLVVGTYDGGTGTLYVDGRAVSTGAFPPPGPVSLPVNIGAYVGGGNGWNGQIDEVQIFDRPLAALEVRAMYDAGSAGQCKLGLGGSDTEWTAPWGADGDVPASGHGFWYLYRGRNGCGDGSYGFATDGSERISAACDGGAP
jgi:hypothetical protein